MHHIQHDILYSINFATIRILDLTLSPSTFAPQEAYDWDRMVELGRRKKAADHMESGAINAGYVDEAAYCSPSKERIEAPADSAIGEATGTRQTTEFTSALSREYQ